MNNRSHKKFNQATLEIWLFIFAISYMFLHILPAFLNREVVSHIMLADFVDLSTPFILITIILRIYFLLHFVQEKKKQLVFSLENVLLFLGIVIYVEGHGMHLSANAVGRLLHGYEHTTFYQLNYFFDERLGHILWDSGFILISAGLVLKSLRSTSLLIVGSKRILLLAGLFYGFTYYVNAVEGQTVILCIPIAIFLPAIIIILSRKSHQLENDNAIPYFYIFAYFISLLFFLIWFIWQGGFPQFSELGWI